MDLEQYLSDIAKLTKRRQKSLSGLWVGVSSTECEELRQVVTSVLNYTLQRFGVHSLESAQLRTISSSRVLEYPHKAMSVMLPGVSFQSTVQKNAVALGVPAQDGKTYEPFTFLSLYWGGEESYDVIKSASGFSYSAGQADGKIEAFLHSYGYAYAQYLKVWREVISYLLTSQMAACRISAQGEELILDYVTLHRDNRTKNKSAVVVLNAKTLVEDQRALDYLRLLRHGQDLPPPPTL